MGAIQVHVKTLKGKKPIVFAWENPTKNVVECFLVTCPCQDIGISETGNLATDPDGAVMCDKSLASALVLALEKADMFTHASLDHMESIVSYINQQTGGKSKSKKRSRPAKKDDRQKEKKQKRMKESSLDFESTASVEEVPADIAATTEIMTTPSLEKEPPSLPLEKCSEDERTHHLTSVEEFVIAACVDISSSIQKLEKEMVETTEAIINIPSLEKEPPSLRLEKCSEDENTHTQSVEKSPVAAIVKIPSNTHEMEKPMDETSEEIIKTPSLEKEPPSLPLEKCSEDESMHAQSVEESPVAACVEIQSNSQEVEKPMDETTEEIINTPSLEKEPPLLPVEKCSDDESTPIQSVELGPVAACVEIPSNSQEVEEAMDETMEEITETPSLEKEPPSLPMEKYSEDESTHIQSVELCPVAACVEIQSNSQEVEKPMDETTEEITNTPSLEKEIPSLPLDKYSEDASAHAQIVEFGPVAACVEISSNTQELEETMEESVKDGSTLSGEKQGGNDVNDSTSVQSVMSNDSVNNGQDAVNGFKTTVPVMNNSSLNIVTSENIAVVTVPAVTNSVASVVAEGGLAEAINSIIEESPETDVTHPQDPP